MHLPHISAIHGQPLFLAEEGVTQLVALANGSGDAAMELAATAVDFWDDRLARIRPYEVSQGVLTIPVTGILLHDFSLSLPWATGYDYIKAAVARGIQDDEIHSILLRVNSPGGMVAGCSDAASYISDAKTQKPISAFADEAAYSAAYWIASAAGELSVARSGGVGSIGVITTHVDYSKMLDASGIKITHIHAGKLKAEGSPDTPLSKEAQGRIQDRIDGLYELFVQAVASNRNIPPDAVKATEAGTFSPDRAIELGLADRIGTRAEIHAALAVNPGQRTEKTMTDKTKADTPATPEITAEAHAGGTAEFGKNRTLS